MLDNKNLKNFHLLEEYEEQMSTSKDYPVDKLPITYPALGLNGEAGEVAEKVKKCWRDNGGVFTEDIKKAILKELADVLWYIWATADDMGYTLEDVILTSMKKVKERQETNTVHGNGDDREEKKSEFFEKYLTTHYEPKKDLSPKYVVGIIGEEESFNVIKNEFKQLLNYRKYPEIDIKFCNDKEDDINFKGQLITFGRLDGCLLINCENENDQNDIIRLIDDHNYKCFINSNILYSRRGRIIPVVEEYGN